MISTHRPGKSRLALAEDANKLSTFLPVCTLVAVILAIPAVAGNPPPSGGEFMIRKSTIDTGGDAGAGADFAFEGTIGQHDTRVIDGGDFLIRGGFRTPSGPSDVLLRDSFE